MPWRGGRPWVYVVFLREGGDDDDDERLLWVLFYFYKGKMMMMKDFLWVFKKEKDIDNNDNKCLLWVYIFSLCRDSLGPTAVFFMDYLIFLCS